MSRLRSRVLLAAGASTLVSTSVAVADDGGTTTAPWSGPGRNHVHQHHIRRPVRGDTARLGGARTRRQLTHFVTWEGADIDRALRFLVPVNVFLNRDRQRPRCPTTTSTT